MLNYSQTGGVIAPFRFDTEQINSGILIGILMSSFVCFLYFSHLLYRSSKYMPGWRKPEIAFLILGRFLRILVRVILR